jgi:hypothetical protein
LEAAIQGDCGSVADYRLDSRIGNSSDHCRRGIDGNDWLGTSISEAKSVKSCTAAKIKYRATLDLADQRHQRRHFAMALPSPDTGS